MATTDGKRFREEFRRAQKVNQEIDVSDYGNIHYELNQALSDAVDSAISEIDENLQEQIREEQYRQGEIQDATRKGDLEALEQLTKYNYK